VRWLRYAEGESVERLVWVLVCGSWAAELSVWTWTIVRRLLLVPRRVDSICVVASYSC